MGGGEGDVREGEAEGVLFSKSASRLRSSQCSSLRSSSLTTADVARTLSEGSAPGLLRRRASRLGAMALLLLVVVVVVVVAAAAAVVASRVGGLLAGCWRLVVGLAVREGGCAARVARGGGGGGGN